MNVIVATSTVADGSMFSRDNPADPEIINNRKRFLEPLGISLDKTTRLKISYDSNNFCRYSQTTAANLGDGMYEPLDASAYDALVTTEIDHALFLPVADCIAATFYDPVHQVLGLAHLGRHSLEQQGATHFTQYLKEHYSSDPRTLKVWLGPTPSKDTYPIWSLHNKGMKEVAFEQLRIAGILLENITNNSAETDTDLTYFSHSQFLKGNQESDGDHAMIAVMQS